MVESALTWSPEAPTSPAARGAISPAAHLADRFAAAEVAGPRGVRLREIPFVPMIGIRVAPASGSGERIAARLAASLPTSCGSVIESGGGEHIVWLSPDEFLIVADRPAAGLVAELVDALDAEPGSVSDLSANRTTFELAGPSARAVLEKGCPLDLHPRSFQTGAAFVTNVGAVPVILWKTGPETYRVLPRSSFADFLGRWLIDAMAEFAAPEVP